MQLFLMLITFKCRYLEHNLKISYATNGVHIDITLNGWQSIGIILAGYYDYKQNIFYVKCVWDV